MPAPGLQSVELAAPRRRKRTCRRQPPSPSPTPDGVWAPAESRAGFAGWHPQGAPCLVLCSVMAILKFLLIFERRAGIVTSRQTRQILSPVSDEARWLQSEHVPSGAGGPRATPVVPPPELMGADTGSTPGLGPWSQRSVCGSALPASCEAASGRVPSLLWAAVRWSPGGMAAPHL